MCEEDVTGTSPVGPSAVIIAESGKRVRQLSSDALQPYYLDDCRHARRVLSKPLILVGGMRNLIDMEAVLSDNIADAVSLCRPFIQGPGAAMVFTTSTAVLTAVVPPSRRGRAMGIVAGSVYAGMAAGPSLSGFIIECGSLESSRT
jgi:hypothetical protein